MVNEKSVYYKSYALSDRTHGGDTQDKNKYYRYQFVVHTSAISWLSTRVLAWHSIKLYQVLYGVLMLYFNRDNIGLSMQNTTFRRYIMSSMGRGLGNKA